MGLERSSGITFEHFPSDTDLVQGCLANNPESWNQMIQKYQRLIFWIARKNGLNSQDTEDVAQTVFLALFRRLPKINNPASLTAYIGTTAHNAAIRQRGPCRHYVDLTDSLPAPQDDIDGRLDRPTNANILHQAVAGLPRKQRDVITAILHEPGEPNYKRIATRLSRPVGSIGPTRERALRKLERNLSFLSL